MDDMQISSSQATQSCSCKTSPATNRVAKWTTVGGILAALGVCAACCLLPFALLSVGVAGAWVSTLESVSASYKWILIALTVALLGYGFHVAYWKPRRTCAAGSKCEVCGTGRSVRIGLWIATILAVSGIVFEQVEPYLAH